MELVLERKDAFTVTNAVFYCLLKYTVMYSGPSSIYSIRTDCSRIRDSWDHLGAIFEH